MPPSSVSPPRSGRNADRSSSRVAQYSCPKIVTTCRSRHRRHRSSEPRTWNGVIDEVCIYNRALSPAEIASIYAAGSAGKCKLPALTLIKAVTIKAVTPSFSNLFLKRSYQLQVSSDMSNWTNQGSPFTATNTSMIYPQYWDVDNWNQLFFRLQVPP